MSQMALFRELIFWTWCQPKKMLFLSVVGSLSAEGKEKEDCHLSCIHSAVRTILGHFISTVAANLNHLGSFSKILMLRPHILRFWFTWSWVDLWAFVILKAPQVIWTCMEDYWLRVSHWTLETFSCSAPSSSYNLGLESYSSLFRKWEAYTMASMLRMHAPDSISILDQCLGMEFFFVPLSLIFLAF